MYKITSMVEGFWRCGVAHPKRETSYPDDFFDAQQLELLQAEPKLVVVHEPDQGKTPPTRAEKLVEACGKLDPDKTNTRYWTKGGVPQVEPLQALTGEKDISAAERDEAYTQYLEGLEDK